MNMQCSRFVGCVWTYLRLGHWCARGMASEESRDRCNRMPVTRRWGLIAFLLVLCAPLSWAQTTDDEFQARANGAVHAVAIQADQRIVVAGQLTEANGAPVDYMARFLPDGSRDTGFATDINYPVYEVALQADGKLVIAGDFYRIDGVLQSRLGRLNADGSRDSSFSVSIAGGSGYGFWLTSVLIQPDQKILIGGEFATVNGVARTSIARLNPDGSLDMTFQPVTFSSGDGVSAMALQPDGKLVIAGDFSSVNGQPRAGMARLNSDGSLDAGFVRSTSYRVNAIVVQADGKILVGGEFMSLAGESRQNLGRLNSDGSLDLSYSADAQTDDEIYAMVLQADGRLVVGGKFRHAGGVQLDQLARFEVDGTLDASFQGLDPEPRQVFALAQQDDGKIVAGFDSDFTNFNLFRLNVDGTGDRSMMGINLPGANATVDGMAVQSNGRVLLTGDFSEINGTARNEIARLHADGEVDSFAPQFDAGVNGAVALPDGGWLLVGGFDVLDGQPRHSLVRFLADGSVDPQDTMGTNGSVNGIQPMPDGTMLIHGSFTKLGEGSLDISRTYLAKLAGDGSVTPFNVDIDARVLGAWPLRNGQILITGHFQHVNGEAHDGIARLNSDGTVDSSFNASINAVATVALELADGKLLVGGYFSTVNGQPRDHLVRLNLDGSTDSSYTLDADWPPRSMLRLHDGKILMGGEFWNLGGNSHPNLVRLLPDGNLDPQWSVNANNTVASVATQADGKILLGGAFTSVDGVTRKRMTRLGFAEPVLQALELRADRKTLEWLRSGRAPHLPWVRMDYSLDGQNWTALGQASRTAGGWQLQGLSLPQDQPFWLRAYGYSAGGNGNNYHGLIKISRYMFLAAPELAFLSGATWASYGETAQYEVALSLPASGPTLQTNVLFSLSPALDAAQAQLTCSVDHPQASCSPTALDPRMFDISLPPGEQATWQLSVPVVATSNAGQAQVSVVAATGTMAQHTTTLVLFRDGFEDTSVP